MLIYAELVVSKLCYVLIALLILPQEYIGYQLSGINDCKDVYIWLRDVGSVECKYLIQPNGHGVHTRAKYYCTEYPLTRCCETCELLEKHKYRYRNGLTKHTTTAHVQNEVLSSTTASASPSINPTFTAVPLRTINPTKPVIEHTTKAKVRNEATLSTKAPFPTLNPNAIQVTFFEIPIERGDEDKARKLVNKAIESTILRSKIKDITRKQLNNTSNSQLPSRDLSHSKHQTQPMLLFKNPNSDFQIKSDPINSDSPLVVISNTSNRETAKEENHRQKNQQQILSPTFTNQYLGQLLQQLLTSQPDTNVPLLTRLRQVFSTSIKTKTTIGPSTIKPFSAPLPEQTPSSTLSFTSTSPPTSERMFTLSILGPTSTPSLALASTSETISTTQNAVKATVLGVASTAVSTVSPLSRISSFTKSDKVHHVLQAVTNETLREPTGTSNNTGQPIKVCKDVGIWLGSGSVPCTYLETHSKWALNKNQLFFCNRFPLTSCCETCHRINIAHGIPQQLS